MANGRPNAVWLSHTALVVPVEVEVGEDGDRLVEPRDREMGAEGVQLQERDRGRSAAGSASSATVAMNSTWRPLEVDPGEGVGGERGDADRDDRRREGDGERVGQPVLHAAGRPSSEHRLVVVEREALRNCRGTRSTSRCVRCSSRVAERVDEQAERRRASTRGRGSTAPTSGSSAGTGRRRRWTRRSGRRCAAVIARRVLPRCADVVDHHRAAPTMNSSVAQRGAEPEVAVARTASGSSGWR